MNDKAIPFTVGTFIPLAMVLFFLQSCSLLKNGKTEMEKNQENAASSNQRKFDAGRTVNTGQHVFEWKLDSSGNHLVLQIWPKGPFTFSPANGFEGEAEKIQLVSSTQNSAAALRLKDSLASTAEQLHAESVHKETNKKQNTNTVKTETPAFWLITGLVVLVIAGVIISRRLR